MATKESSRGSVLGSRLAKQCFGSGLPPRRRGLRPTSRVGWDCCFERNLLRASCRGVDLLTAPRAGFRASPFELAEAVLRLGPAPAKAGATPDLLGRVGLLLRTRVVAGVLPGG